MGNGEPTDTFQRVLAADTTNIATPTVISTRPRVMVC